MWDFSLWLWNKDDKNKCMGEKGQRGVLWMENRWKRVKNVREDLLANENFVVNLQPMRFN